MARTPKAQALGRALRTARGKRTLQDIGDTIGRDIGTLSRWESGERVPKPENVAQFLTVVGVTGADYDEIMTLVHDTNQPHWMPVTLPERRQQMATYLEWESRATRIVEVAPLLVPGLLQTSDYIHAIMTGDNVPSDQIAQRVHERLIRKLVIEKDNPAQLLVLLGQAALSQHIGGRRATVDQLNYLVRVAARPNVELRIVPDGRGWHPGLEDAFSIIEAQRTSVPRTTESIVFQGTRQTVLMLHEDEAVQAHREAVQQIIRVSLDPAASGKLMVDLRTRLENAL